MRWKRAGVWKRAAVMRIHGERCIVLMANAEAAAFAFVVRRRINKGTQTLSAAPLTLVLTLPNKLETIMNTICFVVYLADVSEMTDEIAEALFEAGCNGTPCSREGLAMIHYVREANSIDEAVIPVLDEIRNAGFDFSKVEIDPESLYGLSRNVAVA